MLDYRSIHAAATEKVAALAGETAARRALATVRCGERERARRTTTLFWALRLLTS